MQSICYHIVESNKSVSIYHIFYKVHALDLKFISSILCNYWMYCNNEITLDILILNKIKSSYLSQSYIQKFFAYDVPGTCSMHYLNELEIGRVFTDRKFN